QHLYTTMKEWAGAFDCPIHLNAADRDWIMREGPAVKLWEGDTLKLWDGVTLVRCGGHFPGGTVMHWAGGAGGRGIVCAGDTLTGGTPPQGRLFTRRDSHFISAGGPRSRRQRQIAGAVSV